MLLGIDISLFVTGTFSKNYFLLILRMVRVEQPLLPSINQLPPKRNFSVQPSWVLQNLHSPNVGKQRNISEIAKMMISYPNLCSFGYGNFSLRADAD